MAAGMQVCILEHMVAGKQVCMLVEGMLAHMAVGKQVCKPVGMAADKPEHMAAGKPEHMVAGKQFCKPADMAVGKWGRKPVRKVARTLAHTAGHSIQMNCSSRDCRSIPPIGVLSCTEEATRRLILVVFSL